MKKGDIVLLPFPFTDLSGNKLRPVLILVVNRNDVVVSFITTNESLKTETDISIQSSHKNGLKRNSIVLLN
jgi:mRNA interferase MazF